SAGVISGPSMSPALASDWHANCAIGNPPLAPVAAMEEPPVKTAREDRMARSSRRIALGCVATAVVGLLAAPGFSQSPGPNWVAAWGTSQQSLAETKIGNASIRMIARVTLPGDAVRIRLDNTFGKAPVTFAHATLGPRVR